MQERGRFSSIIQEFMVLHVEAIWIMEFWLLATPKMLILLEIAGELDGANKAILEWDEKM